MEVLHLQLADLDEGDKENTGRLFSVILERVHNNNNKIHNNKSERDLYLTLVIKLI